jgi:hypothetical protein
LLEVLLVVPVVELAATQLVNETIIAINANTIPKLRIFDLRKSCLLNLILGCTLKRPGTGLVYP